MAPLLVQDDEFVLTISDNESSNRLPDEEVEEEVSSAASPPPKGKKRKRYENAATNGSSNGTSKKHKSDKRSRDKESQPGRALDGASLEAGEDVTWREQGHNDGAIDSDFEFQIGDVDTGITEDFDGWGLSTGSTKALDNGLGRANKKGVDIDELIARRKRSDKRRADESATDGQNVSIEDKVDGGESSSVEERQAHSDEDEEVEDPGDKEDESMAPDGFGMGVTDEAEESDGMDEGDLVQEDDSDSSESEDQAAPVPHPDDQASDISGDEKDDPEESARRKAFFAPEEQIGIATNNQSPVSNNFQTMSLSRPILRGLAAVGFSEPTPIQKKAIPVALLGKDVVGGAVTGSGKTAAFMIPILERLLYRPKRVPTSRVAILMPTRELAVQCFNVAKKLANFTDVTFCQLVGGFSLREQESVLRSRPDVIIATPGRFIDHMRNSASFTVDTLEILVLDEADRMLEDGFADELNEILTTIPRSRQTMLFSATMTNTVDKLIRVGLNRPVRLMVDARKQTVGTLVQEFVRLRPGREDKRLAYLMHLCSETYTDRVIIFFRQKKEAHRVRIIFGLCGFKAAELHGSMTQEQRLSSIESFRSGFVTHLLATDVASRGLDIKGVETVINYEAPQSHEIYLHRVGRTARAGRTGRSCTIAAEPDRKVVKAAVRGAKAQGAKILSRAVDAVVADVWAKKVEDMEGEIEDIMREEKEEKQLGQAEMQVRKGENFIRHEDEIKARPKRTWFESEKEKRTAKKTGRAELNGPDPVSTGKKKGKLSGKDKKKLDDARERTEGKVWKKGKAERAGKGALDKRAGSSGKGGKRPNGASKAGRSGKK